MKGRFGRMETGVTGTVRITCARGIAGYLEAEVQRLGCEIVSVDDTGVEIRAGLAEAMRLNLYLRTAQNVLYLLDEFGCSTPDELYERAGAFAWEELIHPDGYFSIAAVTDTPTITDSRFATQRLKDAIVDRFNERFGRRPDSGPDRERLVLHLYWRDDRCWIYLNLSGRKLADRNYRKMPHKAPMQEALAAAVLMEAGYDGSQPLVNPMCGSGTLAIEAALIASGRPPGLLRDNFGFMHMVGFDDEAWQAMRREARQQRQECPPARIIASDIDDRALRATEQNAKTAGVDHLIELVQCDFADTPIPPEPGIVILNPEYGRRLGSVRELEAVYKRIGDFFKQKCPGWRGCVFTGNPQLAKRVGLRPSRRVPFFNASIECRLLKYELYAGSRERREGEK